MGAAGGAGAVPYVSSLRVFEPLDAFDDADQVAFMARRAIPREHVEAVAAADSWRRITRTVSDPFPHDDRGQVRAVTYPTVDGMDATYYCPDQISVRSTVAAQTLLEGLREQLADVLIPVPSREANQSRLESGEIGDGEEKIYTRQATWGVPFSWFALVHEQDRTQVVRDGDAILTVRLTAPLRQAIDRARRAVAGLAVAAPELDLLDELTELAEWLELFHEDSVVELDYGPVAGHVYPDDSPSDVREGIESLAEGDTTAAAAAYRRLASRWIPLRQLARAS